MTKHWTHHDEAHWNKVAADYDRWAGAFTAHYARAALAVAGGGVPGARVIDVAAGTGALALAAAEAGARVLATDISSGMVDVVGAKLRAFLGCAAQVMDGQALSLDAATFDAGFSVFGIMLFPDWAKGLDELVRVVRPGGRVVVASWTGPRGAGPTIPFLDAYASTFPEVALPPPPAGMVVMSDRAAFESAMTRAGCRDVVVHTVEGAWTGASLDQVMNNLDSLMRFSPLYTDLDAAGRAALAGPLRQAYATFVDDTGTLSIPSTAHIAVGRKA